LRKSKRKKPPLATQGYARSATRIGMLHCEKQCGNALLLCSGAEPNVSHVVVLDENGGTRCPNSSEVMALGSSQEV
jgi:hypothetical protein